MTKAYGVGAPSSYGGLRLAGLPGIALLLCLVSNFASAKEPVNPLGNKDAEDLLGYCRKWNDGTLEQWTKNSGSAELAATLRDKCATTIQATLEIAQYTNSICPPGNAWEEPLSTKMELLFPYAEKHRDQWGDGFAVLVFKAFQERWPCK